MAAHRAIRRRVRHQAIPWGWGGEGEGEDSAGVGEVERVVETTAGDEEREGEEEEDASWVEGPLDSQTQEDQEQLPVQKGKRKRGAKQKASRREKDRFHQIHMINDAAVSQNSQDL